MIYRKSPKPPNPSEPSSTVGEEAEASKNQKSAHANPGESPPPSWDDYWAHQIAENAKRKIIAHFAILGVIVSIILTIIGWKGITGILKVQFERGAKIRVEKLINKFEKELNLLRSQAKIETERVIVRIGEDAALLVERLKSTSASLIVEKIDLSADIGSIRNQGREGTSVGFPLAYALQAELKRLHNEKSTISVRSIYVKAKEYDEWPGEDYEGTSVLGGLKAMHKDGVFTEQDWPYSRKNNPVPGTQPKYKISNYTELKGIEGVLDTLRKKKPVVTEIKLTPGFSRAGPGGRVVLSDPQILWGGHAICIVGYNSQTTEFKFANSWGTSWANGGFGFIRSSDLEMILQSAYSLSL